MGADGRLLRLGWLVNPALLPALLALLGWAAWQTRKTLRIFTFVGLARSRAGVRSVADPECARAAPSFRCAARLDSNYGWETAPEQRAFWMNRCFRCSTDGNSTLCRKR